MWSCSSLAAAAWLAPLALAAGVLGLGALAVPGCGREDVELSSKEPAGGGASAADCSAAVPDGLLASRPPMGWNGYNSFACAAELDEAKLTAIVDALVASGMQSAGYRYVNLDDCWWLPSRSAEGQRLSDPARLPSGIQALSERLHARGFSLGIFSTIQSCGHGPGGDGHEAVDAESYARWGVDYVKYVQCGDSPVVERSTTELAAALLAAGRDIVLSLDAPPFREWMRDTAQLSRLSGDAVPTWASITSAIDTAVPLAAYARPGAFNDPDMLEIGNGALTAGEKRVQFSVWSILSAPLIAGNDLTAMTEETRVILTNGELIKLNQDPLGLQGARVQKTGDVEVLAKPLAACGARGVVLWNRAEGSAEVSVPLREVWLEPGTVSVHDLWSGSLLPSGPAGFTVTVPGHDAVALRVEGSEPPLPSGRVYLSDLRWTYVTNGYGPVELDTTNGEDQALDGRPLQLRGTAYEKGLGVHGPSLIRYRLGQACSKFTADVGIDDDQGGQGSAQFEVWADGVRLFQSGRLTGNSPSSAVSVDLRGRRDLRLFVGVGGDSYEHDHGVWAGALLECDALPPQQSQR